MIVSPEDYVNIFLSNGTTINLSPKGLIGKKYFPTILSLLDRGIFHLQNKKYSF